MAGLLVASVAVLLSVTHSARSYSPPRGYLSIAGWPSVGEGAYQIGSGRPHASSDQQPVSIASVAKVMTAYLVARRYPLAPDASGFSMTVSAANVADTERRRQEGQSLVPVSVGEALTERQALNALLLPSANNIAIMLARAVAGSVSAFVREMNRTARQLGMRHTSYTDPSGYASSTVSTAADQLLLAEKVAHNPTIAPIMAAPSYPLPVAGTVENTDTLLGSDGFVGMKTGSDEAAGGCFMFHIRRRQDGRTLNLVGVVLGQQGPNLINAGLDAATQLDDRIARPPDPATTSSPHQ
jgi:serine-type D-Ala-D-Ala carboxypeptidase (penicillin-binding protein 5/6)